MTKKEIEQAVRDRTWCKCGDLVVHVHGVLAGKAKNDGYYVITTEQGDMYTVHYVTIKLATANDLLKL